MSAAVSVTAPATTADLLKPWQRVNTRIAEVALAASRLDIIPPALRRAATVPGMRCEPGADPVGGMVEFAEPLAIAEEARDHGWLAIHLSSFFGLSTTTAEHYATAPYDPEGTPYLDRIRWVRDRAELWRRIVADPLGSLEWARSEVTDPWSALAAVFEWVRYLEAGFGMASRLPVVIEAGHIRTMLPPASTLDLATMPECVRGLPGAVLMARGEGMVVVDAGGGVFATHAGNAWRLAWFMKDGIESAPAPD